jgi:hypothetical protein
MAITASDLAAALQESMAIGGAIAVAIVDMDSGETVAKAGGSSDLDLDLAAAGNAQIIRAKRDAMHALGVEGDVEDILITLPGQHHLIRPLGADKRLFLYLVLNKTQSNLAPVLRDLAKVGTGLVA